MPNFATLEEIRNRYGTLEDNHNRYDTFFPFLKFFGSDGAEKNEVCATLVNEIWHGMLNGMEEVEVKKLEERTVEYLKTVFEPLRQFCQNAETKENYGYNVIADEDRAMCNDLIAAIPGTPYHVGDFISQVGAFNQKVSDLGGYVCKAVKGIAAEDYKNAVNSYTELMGGVVAEINSLVYMLCLTTEPEKSSSKSK